MKRLQMTPALSAMIKAAVGNDVDTEKLAVFESISLNNKPLPGKRGTIFAGAVPAAQTLAEMVDHINGPGGSLPLMTDHIMYGAPNGRVFHAGLNYGDDSSLEMRTLFYLLDNDPDVAKLDQGIYDEVSVQFLPKQFTCSACAFDFIGGTPQNLNTLTCDNDHTIGKDGVHANLIGLDQFVEVSLVARGAADKPKIVGRSESKLAPETVLRLAAKGFEPDALVVRASIKEVETMDTTKLVTDLTAATSQVAVLSHEKTTLTTQLTAVTGERDTARTELATANQTIATLTQERDAALQRPEASVLTERDEAVAILQDQLNGVLVALGRDKLEGDALPKTPAELKTKLSELTADLTAILPAPGGASRGTGASGDAGPRPLVAAAYSLRK
jgi:hypothetical protein